MARKQYTAEFKAEAVRLVCDGKRHVASVARELGIGQQTLSGWVKQADIDDGRGPEGTLTTAERTELQRLRRENKRLQEERDILKKATAFFAKESR
jgi:transposase-like protein